MVKRPEKNPALKELKTAFLARLGRLLAEHGFDSRPRGQSFRRPSALGHSSVHVTFIDHASDVDLTVDFALRVDAVESMVNAGNRMLSEREKQTTATVGVELGNLSDRRQRRWTLANAKDVPAVADSVAHEVVRFGIPYFERLGDLPTMLALLSSKRPADWLHAPIHGGRCMRALALAQLVAPERKAEVYERCLRILADRHDIMLHAFQRLGAELSVASPE